MRNLGIGFLKVLAIVAVIVLHVQSTYHYFFPQQITLQFLTITDQISRLAVPMFVALSGLGLALGYGQKKIDLGLFFKRRVLRLLPWYLFFATIIILAVTFVFGEDKALYPNLELWRLYVLGKADYHLYFVPMIIQMYLLFPLIMFLFRRIFPVGLLILAGFWQIYWYLQITRVTEVLGNNNRIWPDQQQYLSGLTWIFYFVLGIYLASKIARPSRWWLFGGLAATIVGLIWSVESSLSLTSSGIDFLVATRFTRLPVLLYATGTIALGVSLAGFFKSFPKSAVSFVAYLGKISYVVYLSHTLVLRVVFRQLDFVTFAGFGGSLVVIILVSFLSAAILDQAVARLYDK